MSQPDIAIGKVLLTRWLDEVINGRNLALVDEIMAADYLGHTPAQPEPVRGRDGYRQFIGRIHAASRDMRASIDDLFAEGDRVLIRMTLRGTQNGVYQVSDFLQGIPATGRRFEISQTIAARVADARIAETWQELDALGFMQQLGLIPPPGVGPAGLLGWAIGTIVYLGSLKMRSSLRRPRRDP